jgi:UDP-glucose 4-epimerase
VKVLVTGGTGFLGRHVVADLLRVGHAVTTLGRAPAPADWPCPHEAADIGSEAARRAAARAEAIVHLAGLPDVGYSLRHPAEVGRVNAGGTLNILEGARERGARVVLLSTQRVYARALEPLAEDAPLAADTPYGLSKRHAEQWCALYHQQYGVPTVVLRGFSIYGPGQVVRGGSSGVVSILAQRALAGLPLEIDGAALRDFVAVADLVQAVRLALHSPQAAGRVYNVGTGVATTLVELAAAVCRAVGVAVPIRCPSSAPAPGFVADITRIRAELGYAPTVGLAEGLEQYVAWLRAARPHSSEGAADPGAARR